MERNIFECKEILAIISCVRRKEREISLRFHRFIFPVLYTLISKEKMLT
jgi:hypothetical protein